MILLLLVLFCASGLFDHSLWTPNDSREGGMIAESYRTGRWTALTLNGNPFLEKPPLLHWMALVLCTVAGHVSPGLVRMPAALCGFGTALIVWAWGRRLGREKAGALAALLCVTNITYYEYSRIVLTDMALTFAVLAALHAFWTAYDATESSLTRYGVFLLATALSFFAKGLAGPVFIMGSVVAFLTVQRQWKQACALSLVFVPLLVLAVFPWADALYRIGGREYLISAFVDNQLGRFFRLPVGGAITQLPVVGRLLGFMANRPIPNDPYFVHKEPIYHYLIKLPTRLLPWTLMVLPALVYTFKSRGPLAAPLATLLRCAVVAIFVVLHVASSKAGVYALPVFPILFLMIGVWCEDAGSTGLSRIEAWILSSTCLLVQAVTFSLPALYLILFALPRSATAKLALFASANGAAPSIPDPSSWVWLPGKVVAWMGAALCVAALVVAIRSVRTVHSRLAGNDIAGAVSSLAVTLAIVVMLAGTAAMPAYDRQRSYRPVAELAQAELSRGHRVALATPEQQIVGLFVFYTGRSLPVIDPVPGVRAFLESSPEPAGVIVRTSQLPLIEPSLRGVPYEVHRMADDAGWNARELCLITRP